MLCMSYYKEIHVALAPGTKGPSTWCLIGPVALGLKLKTAASDNLSFRKHPQPPKP